MVDAETISNQELLELDVDVLIPAALENVITQENAKAIRAPVIIEVANGPTTSEGDAILNAAKKIIVPDILANAGGVTVSYFEWVQNKQGYYWTEGQVHERLKEIMTRAFDAVHAFAEKHSIDMRTAAYAHALNRIGQAIEAVGTQSYFKAGS
jgi:glutamate dehydrogenase (NADP+)